VRRRHGGPVGGSCSTSGSTVTRTPHNDLFHVAFSQIENARGELRAVLPEALVSRIDWSTLQLSDGHYVDEQFRHLQSDLLYTVMAEGQPIALYLLFEHQSTGDPLMAFRLLRYMVGIWDRWLADHANARKLPAIVPVVLSHVEGGWRGATSMQELYDLPDDMVRAASPHLPAFEFVLDDLLQRTDEELRRRLLPPVGRVALALFRWGRSEPDLLSHLKVYGAELQAMWHGPDGKRALVSVFRYVALAREPVTLQDLGSYLIATVGEEAREVVMTEGQRMIDEWRAEGEARGRAKALLAVFAARGLSVSEPLRERIMGCTDIATLDKWIMRGATALSAAEAISET
jgi:hypothetical protein